MLTQKIRYALNALIYLSNQQDEKTPVSLNEIASITNMSLSYLEQIFVQLKLAGLVDSFKGPGGGYLLKIASKDIKLLDIINAVDESIKFTTCNKSNSCKELRAKGEKCASHDLWRHMNIQMSQYFSNISLSDIQLNNFKNFV